jgi:hypothetical protein
MKSRIIAVVAIIFLVQAFFLVIFFGKVGKTPIEHTPVPTLIPVFEAKPTLRVQQVSFGAGQCSVSALDLLGDWVKAGKPESAPFDFQSETDQSCQATFPQDVLPLFTQPNIWFDGAIACSTCHGSDLTKSAAKMSMVDYANIIAGSRRDNASTKGNDILGDGANWSQARLYIMILSRQMPMGRPADSPQKGPIIHVGTTK